MIDRVIWDFNGTILDDLKISIESADKLLNRYGLEPIISVEKYYRVFGFPIIDYYRRIGFDFSKTDYTVLAHEWVDIYLSLLPYANVRDGIPEVIDRISSLGIKQTILSMTKEEMLIGQLRSLGIYERFDEVCGLNDIYASSKLELAKKWRERHPDESVLYIGDTIHDAESADVIGCTCLMLLGGHQNEETLKETGREIIAAPKEILKYIEPEAYGACS